MRDNSSLLEGNGGEWRCWGGTGGWRGVAMPLQPAIGSPGFHGGLAWRLLSVVALQLHPLRTSPAAGLGKPPAILRVKYLAGQPSRILWWEPWWCLWPSWRCSSAGLQGAGRCLGKSGALGDQQSHSWAAEAEQTASVNTRTWSLHRNEFQSSGWWLPRRKVLVTMVIEQCCVFLGVESASPRDLLCETSGLNAAVFTFWSQGSQSLLRLYLWPWSELTGISLVPTPWLYEGHHECALVSTAGPSKKSLAKTKAAAGSVTGQEGHLSIFRCTKSFPGILFYFFYLVCFLPAAYLNLIKVTTALYKLWSSSGSPKYSPQNPGKKLSKTPNNWWLPRRVTANLPDPLANSSITACLAKKSVALNMV